MQILIAGDSTLVVKFGNEINEEINQRVRAFRSTVEKSKIEGILEYIPTYCTVYVFYDPLKIKTKDIIKKLNQIEEDASHTELPKPNIVEVPVAYGGENGPDISNVAEAHGITPEDVIRLHSSKEYLVYMLGFTPGFTFCGGLGDDLATPRIKNPRTKVPAGSVGIAGKQTGLYAISSPGGWQLIGRTTKRFYNPEATPPVPIKAGDYIRFVPISAEEFEAHRSDVEAADNPPDYSNWNPEGTPVFSVSAPGALTTIQDRGRFGYQEVGISASGAMDELAFRLANKIIGNDDNAPALEITLLGPRLEVQKEVLIAVTGADLSFTINDQTVPLYTAIKVEKGDVIAFGAPKKGMRAYIAVNGGISVPLVMGSAATNLGSKLGGYMGRKLEKGDVLKSIERKIPETFIGYSINPDEFTFGAKENVYRVILGPEDDHFTEEGINTFFSSEYKLSDKCDRMGARMEGPVIKHNEKGPGIVSDGITMGAIQVPGDGYPLVLLKDRGTVGGYSKIGTICSIDAYRFAQKKPSETVRFEMISLEDAQKLLLQMEHKLSKIGLKQKIHEITGCTEGDVYRVTIGSSSYDVLIEDF